jgi:hypothetical protein
MAAMLAAGGLGGETLAVGLRGMAEAAHEVADEGLLDRGEFGEAEVKKHAAVGGVGIHHLAGKAGREAIDGEMDFQFAAPRFGRDFNPEPAQGNVDHARRLPGTSEDGTDLGRDVGREARVGTGIEVLPFAEKPEDGNIVADHGKTSRDNLARAKFAGDKEDVFAGVKRGR